MTFLPQEIIGRKRDRQTLAAEEIGRFVAGMADGSVTAAQVGAFAMAVFLNGMDAGEVVALTLAMRDSGAVLAWPGLDGPVVDKHSTGGVGDNVSLMLAPMLAACGCYVPMISGRGLGHSGGTLDKLEAIPGYQTQVDPGLLRRVVGAAGCAIVGPAGDLAPADGRLYAIRDVTATVESLPLIVSSILSKKLAAGLDSLVLDVKTGNGAFVPGIEQARELAQALVRVANGAGVRTAALLTDMNEPLASAAGNALEVRNAVDFLTGSRRDAQLYQVVLALGETLLVLAGRAADKASAARLLAESLDSGAAAERFGRMVARLGGPADFLTRAEACLPAAVVVRDVPAAEAGVVAAIDVRAIGMAVVALGGGRTRAEDDIDRSVGFDRLMGIGAQVGHGVPLGRVHARSVEAAEMAVARLRAAYRIGGEAARPPLIVEQLTPEGV